jgi:drug/metabolite transporter (DMT)-like permease
VPLRSLLQLFFLGCLWGSSYLFIKVAVEGMSPLMVVATRLFFGSLLLLTVIRVRGLQLPREQVMWAHLVFMAVVGIVIPWTLISWGTQHIDSGLAAVLNSTTPFFTILFVVVAFRVERLTVPRALGLVLGFTGVAILTGADVTQIASASVQGQLAVLLSSIAYGLGFAYARRYVRGDAIVLAGCQIGLAFVIMLPLALALGNPAESEFTLARVGSVLALGLLTSGVAYIIYYRLIADIGATMASYATFLIPIVGLVLGWSLLGEIIGRQSILGVAFILIGLAVATMLHHPRPVEPEGSTASAAAAATPHTEDPTRHA